MSALARLLFVLALTALLVPADRTVAADGPLPERLDRLVAAALAELDRLERSAAAKLRAMPTSDPPPAAIAAQARPLTLRRLRRLFGRIDGLLAETEAPPDPLVARLVAQARRAVGDAYRRLGPGPAVVDVAAVRTALLRTDAASAALWSLRPLRPP